MLCGQILWLLIKNYLNYYLYWKTNYGKDGVFFSKNKIGHFRSWVEYGFILFILYNAFNFHAINSLKGFYTKIFFTFFKFIVLFCAIIPIDLRVNLVISKSFFSFVINNDKSIPKTIVRNNSIPEKLGRISWVFGEGTGALTKNEMIFKGLAMGAEIFEEDSFHDLKKILEDQ